MKLVLLALMMMCTGLACAQMAPAAAGPAAEAAIPLPPQSATDSAKQPVTIVQETARVEQTGANGANRQAWSPDLVKFLSIRVLGFTCLALGLASALLWRSRAQPMQVLKVIGILCIIGFSAMLLVVGYDNAQLTPIVGLFGAIAGYLLGKDTKASGDEQ